MTTAWTVVEIDAVATHGVRRAVLRVGTPTTEVAFAEDTMPGAVHLGIVVDDELVATSSWIPRPFPGPPPGDASDVQLRGMATLQHLQGTGAGACLLREGIARARDGGSTRVWANARDAALAFYLRHGFAVVGEGFVDEATQLPHHRVVNDLT